MTQLTSDPRLGFRAWLINWHSILINLVVIVGIIWNTAYPDINPADPHYQMAVNAVLAAIVAAAFAHKLFVMAATQTLIREELAVIKVQLRLPADPTQPTGPVQAYDPRASRDELR